MQMESQVIQVNLDDIIPNRFQPRIAFDEKALNELAASIKEHGIIQPLVLRKLGKKYEIIAGERRYKAATMAGLQTVPAVISNIDDNKSAEVALVENIQRKDLTPIEEARSYKNLLDKGYLTQEQLAKKMGLSQSAISNKLRLLNLDIKVQQALLDNKISERHARSLLKLTNVEDQKKWLDKIIKERLTVKKLDELLKKEIDEKNDDTPDVPLVDSPDLEQIKEQATDINAVNKKNIANLLVSEDTMTEYSDNLPNENVDVSAAPVTQEATPIGQSTTLDPFSSAPTSPEVLNDVPATNNKFFNPLEDSPATMDNLNPFAKDANFTVDQTPTEDSEVEVFDVPAEPTPVEEPLPTAPTAPETPSVPEAPVAPTSIDSLGQESPFPAPMPQPMTMDSMNQPMGPMPDINSMPSDPMMGEPTSSAINELNPNNKFFQPIQEQSVSNNIMDMNPAPAPINPMDSVDNLVRNDSNVVEELKQASLSDAINDIRSKVEELNIRGLNVTIDEADLQASYQMNISILK